MVSFNKFLSKLLLIWNQSNSHALYSVKSLLKYVYLQLAAVSEFLKFNVTQKSI